MVLVKAMIFGTSLSRQSGFRMGVTLLAVSLCCAALPTAALALSAAPAIDSESASHVTDHSATLEGEINPEGLETKYEFWLQYAVCQSTLGASCEAIAVTEVGDGYITTGGGDIRVTANLASLQPNYTYTYFILAINRAGTTKGPSQEFKAVENEGVLKIEGHPLPPPENTQTPYEISLAPWVPEGDAAEAARLVAQEEQEAKESPQYKEEQEREEVKTREERQSAEEAAQGNAKKAVAICLVPSLKGESLAAARSALHRNHCRLGRVTRPRGHRGALIVTSQNHPRGTKLPYGATIAVSLGTRRHRT